ncbi:hypothetical protein NEAUS04_1664 [Nematocida ausubeli]|uniref:Uncharacterized protein n=1 Tax=Nematocida ausubeli (strain ATCC PRA-371 / ERTm2) TaxID=1913371 RepID=A0A086J449_NEMA1|nr:uncharacterized protein NESG_01073 [Nematocida ausubeli]KAI5163561.1 hypothetical protein NEAUS04_1664 [Nematocida ausubeli]KFG26917.1 hypothetical protein NESG_01073 [Nematocida ausubeli]
MLLGTGVLQFAIKRFGLLFGVIGHSMVVCMHTHAFNTSNPLCVRENADAAQIAPKGVRYEGARMREIISRAVYNIGKGCGHIRSDSYFYISANPKSLMKIQKKPLKEDRSNRVQNLREEK